MAYSNICLSKGENLGLGIVIFNFKDNMSSKKKDIKVSAKYKYIYCDIYKRGVSVFIGDCASLRKWAKKFYNYPEVQDMVEDIQKICNEEEYRNKGVAARCYYSDYGYWVVHLPIFSFTYNPVEIANLSHELLHATFGILDYAGMEYRYSGNNEGYTYLHEYLLTEALTEKGYKNVK